ncbi:MAG: AMP-binding protein, partial [bacterium]|nr:AMP-binding protein [bacterium]
MKKDDKKNIANIMVLTPMQQGMLYHYLKEPADGLYFEQLTLELSTLELSTLELSTTELSGRVEKELFEKAWNTVIQANEMLRTFFRWKRIKNPVGVVLKQYLIKPRYYDSQDSAPKVCHPQGTAPLKNGIPDPDQEQERQKTQLDEIKAKDRKEGFDLQNVPFRITLYKHENHRYTIIISHHHILYDGWSTGIILKEFFTAYELLSKGKTPEPIAKTQFKDFIKWHRDRDKNKEKKFWKNYLIDLTAKTGRDIPAKPAKPTRKRKKTKFTEDYRYLIPAEIENQLKHYAKQRDITLATVLYSAWGILLKQYKDTGNILFDTTVSGRTAKLKGIEDMVGLFINTLPILLQTKPGDRITDFLSRTDNMLPKWSQYENSSRLEINEYLEEIYNSQQNHFDTLVVIENYPLDKITIRESGTLSAKNVCHSGRTPYDLTAIITVFEGLKIELTYNKELFDKAAAENMCDYFTRLLREIPVNPEKEVSTLDIVPKEERRRILKAVNTLYETGKTEKIEYKAPRDKTEEKLTAIWSPLLKLEKNTIGIDMDFFQFGGHSLKAALLSARIHEALEIKMPLTMVFKHPTIREQAKYINTAVKESYAAIEPAEKKEYYPASPAQKRMYTLKQMEPESIAYNVSAVLLMEGPLPKNRLTAFENSFKNLLHRHESLRTSFDIIETGEIGTDWEIVQVIQKDVDFIIEYFNLQDLDTDKDQDLQPETGIIKRFIRPFDLSRAPLIRVGVIKQEKQKHLLMFDAHHIVSDGTSMNIFIEEFMAQTSGKRLPTQRIQYKDYTIWQERRNKQGKTGLKQQEAYWLNRYAGELPELNLPTDYPKIPDPTASTEGDTLIFRTGSELHEKVRNLGKNSGATLYMILMAAYNLLLMKYSAKEDIVVGSLTDGRPHPDMKTIIGVMIATLAMRNYPARQKTFRDFLQEVKNDSLQAFENSDYQFEELLKQLPVKRDINKTPLFDTMFLLQNYEWTDLTIKDLTIKPYHYKKNTSTFQLRLTATELEKESEIEIEIQYDTRQFKETTIHRLTGHFLKILHEVTAKPNKTLGEIEILTEAERRKILVEFNDTTKDTGKKKTIYRLFEEQVQKTPDKIAIIGSRQLEPAGKQEKKENAVKEKTSAIPQPASGIQIAYRELNKKVNRLARYLRKKGVSSSPVGILMKPTPQMIISILAVSKAGGAYMPVDPANPEQRIKIILKDSGATHLLIHAGTTGQKPQKTYGERIKIIDLAIEAGEIAKEKPGNPIIETTAGKGKTKRTANLDKPIYIIYTSGTSGKPKGAA